MQALCQNKKAFTDNDLQEISFFFWANCKKNRHSFSFATQNLAPPLITTARPEVRYSDEMSCVSFRTAQPHGFGHDSAKVSVGARAPSKTKTNGMFDAKLLHPTFLV
jgi:hypothetical protein